MVNCIYNSIGKVRIVFFLFNLNLFNFKIKFQVITILIYLVTLLWGCISKQFFVSKEILVIFKSNIILKQYFCFEICFR